MNHPVSKPNPFETGLAVTAGECWRSELAEVAFRRRLKKSALRVGGMLVGAFKAKGGCKNWSNK